MTNCPSGRRNAPWLLLIAAALMLRALVPQGMMLQHGEGEGFALALCPSDQTFAPLLAYASATSDHAGHAGHDHSMHAGDGLVAGDADAGDPQNGASGEPHTKPCTFSANSSAALAPDLPVLSLPRVAQATHDAIRERTLQPAKPPVAPPARAPPVPA